MLKLAYQYMRYYKSQTFAIFVSVFLTAALMSGIGSLMYSSRKNDVENSRRIYGDWHYCIETGIDAETKTFPVSGTDTVNGIKGEGFRLERYAKAQVTGELSEPYQIQFLHVDEFYRRMLCREITEGREPNAANEIAADSYTLANLGFEGGVGDALKLGGKSYILTGLVKSKWNSGADEMEVFVGKGTGQTKIYLRFDENEKLYKQMEAFQQRYNIPGDAVETNDSLTMYLRGERPDSIYDIIYAMAVLLGVFSLFVIYSVFNISVSKRKAEYAVLQTLEIGETAIGGTLVLELWILFLAGYPLGCLSGNGILRLCYQWLGGVFANKTIGRGKTAVSVTDRIAAQGTSMQGADNAGFYVSWAVIYAGFIFLFFALAAAGFLTVRAMRRHTLRESMGGDVSFFKGRRKIYSRRGADLANAVVRKFMFWNKRRAAGVILSLSVGGCIFLCMTYMVENLKVHAEMSLKSDDGLGSEYRISVKSDCLADTIPRSAVDEMKKNTGAVGDLCVKIYSWRAFCGQRKAGVGGIF